MQTSVSSELTLSGGDFKKFQAFLEDACGIVLGAGKEYLVTSRLSGLMRMYDINSVGELMIHLQTGRNPRLRTSIIDAMTTNETFWFRDAAHFRLLEDRVLPAFAATGKLRIRIWSAACSFGQEPYNLSMVIEDTKVRSPSGQIPRVEIIATDISTMALEEARKGVYSGMAASRGLDSGKRNRHFTVRGDGIEVKPEIKKRVSFRELNLTKGYELLGRFDVIFCRNVLIYFSGNQKQDILKRMARILNPGGYLFLGSTESLAGHTDQFEMVSESGGIGYRLKS
ncbi:MAG: protein-glutamate O-methyltransferase CheR [Gammaproteobacteria bacterium]|nr:protein-glutamate O-methyltransferase CheR [Gammaproteobacteria bacterium]